MTVFDISQLSEQNPWWISADRIFKDQKIIQWEKSKIRWDPRIRHFIKLDNDVIYTLRGPRQVGKTTLVKIIIKNLLINQNVKPKNVFFWDCTRNNLQELHDIMKIYLEWRINGGDSRKYIFLDEVCGIIDWTKEIKYFSNMGDLKNCSLVVTGSHSMDMKHSTELLPGRRGGDGSNPLDKILLPMKFSEFAEMMIPNFKQKMFDYGVKGQDDRKNKILALFRGKIDSGIEEMMIYKRQLDSILEDYLLTGGIPSTINEYVENEKISANLFTVYLNAIIGDLKKYNYKEESFKQMTKQIFVKLTTPVSWNEFTKNTEVKSHNTIADYMMALEELFVAKSSYRHSVTDGRIHTYLKKIYIQDPFIFHALHGFVNSKKDYFENAKANVLNLETKSKLIECVVHNHISRFAYCLIKRDLFDPKDFIFFYRDKREKEIDFLLLYDDKFYPFEVKYQRRIENSDFRPFENFKCGVLITKDEFGLHGNFVKIPLSVFLALV